MIRSARGAIPHLARLALASALGVGLGAVPSVGQEPARWSVAARILSPDAPVDNAEWSAPSTSLPPQYQTTRLSRDSLQGMVDDGSVRVVVCLTERPLLVEVRITVDGKPFRQLRAERVEALLRGLSQPVPTEAPSAPTEADEVAPSETGLSPTPETPAQPTAPASPTADRTIPARLRRYVEATKRLPTSEELDWWLTNWGDGPALLYLDVNYQRVRADALPLFRVVDRDENGILSSAEMEVAAQSLLKYDANQDEVLTLAEINKGAERTPAGTAHESVPPPWLGLEQLASATLLRQLGEVYRASASRFDANGDGQMSAAELTALREAKPDLVLAVAFDTRDATNSRLTVADMDAGIADVQPVLRDASLTLLIDKTWLELSAVQSHSGFTTDHISIGAVRDGYPLLPEVDLNEDGRLTVRELRQVASRLAKFDRDGDGNVASSEIFPTLRLAVGHGPIVHGQLAEVRRVHPAVPPSTDTPPDWFARMDRNQDGDLTPREFLGGQDQFQMLDADADGLISIGEAKTGGESRSTADGTR